VVALGSHRWQVEWWNRHVAVWLTGFTLLFALQISGWWYPAPDAVRYLSQARALLEGRFAAFGYPQLGYPPGYALLVSPAVAISQPPFLAVSVVHFLLAVALTLGLYHWSRRQVPEAAVLASGVVLVNVSLWTHFRRPLSEFAFLTVLVWTAAALDQSLEPQPRAVRVRRILAGSLLLLLLSLIREVGILVVAGFACAAIVHVWRRHLRTASAVGMVVLAALPAVGTVAAFTLYEAGTRTMPARLGTHLDGILHVTNDLIPRLIEGLRLRISEVGRLLIPGMFKSYAASGDWLDINLVIYTPCFVLVAVGWWRFVRRRQDVLALTLPFYLAAYVIWSFDSGTRYLLPLLPVLVVSLWHALQPVAQYRALMFSILLLGHFAVAAGYWLVIDLPRARACSAAWRPLAQLAAQIMPLADSGAAALPLCERLLLTLVIDRPLLEDEPPAAKAQWIIDTDGVPVPDGFRLQAHAGAYRLLVRSGL
jgi:hypothetical protein